MNANSNARVEAPGSIPPDTRMGPVHFTVADLDGQIAFYERVIGLQVHWREGVEAGLGAGQADLLRLTELPDARRPHGTTGLYHFAILLPDRPELARAVARLFALRYPNHPTDHVMTKTTYLDDPEGNNIELYADTPEDGVFEIVGDRFRARHADGTLSGGRERLDVDALFRELSPVDRLDQPMPPETTIGHVHLYVADLDESMRFYHGVLGFDNMGIARDFRMGMVSAGGYHHHVGFNTWVGEGAPPPPPNSLGLRHVTVLLPDEAALEAAAQRLRQADGEVQRREDGVLAQDPSRNGVLLSTEARQRRRESQ